MTSQLSSDIIKLAPVRSTNYRVRTRDICVISTIFTATISRNNSHCNYYIFR